MQSIKTYKRIFESMGKGLILIKVFSVISRKNGLLFHRLLADNVKPPMDIAFDITDKTVEYSKFFLQNEKIVSIDYMPKICEGEIRISLPKEVTEKNYHCYSDASFVPYRFKNDLWIIKKGYEFNLLTTFSLNEENYLLFNQEDLAGLLLKNINLFEIRQLELSDCL